MKQDVLAIIGVGEAAKLYIDKARELHVKTVGFGKSDSKSIDIVDFFVEFSDDNNLNTNYIVENCRKYGVTGIIASNETSTEAAALAAHALGLPGNSVDGGFAGKNKYIMRCRVDKLTTVSQPKFSLYDKDETYNYPVVVKSLDAAGKRGISIAYNEDDLRRAAESSKIHSSNGMVLLEEYLAGGKEYSIECISGNGQHYIVQYTEKDTSGPPYFIETGHHQPAKLSAELKNRIDVATKDILEVLGLNCGMTHLELKIINDKIYFIEVGARAGGDHIADILTINSTSYDYFKAAILCSLGRFEYEEIVNTAYTGIYFHCKQNQHISALFDTSKNADWCIVNTVNSSSFNEASTNQETAKSGYFIYKSDHKITLSDANIDVVDICKLPNAYELIRKHLEHIKKTDINIDAAIYKWLSRASYLAILNNDQIICRLILYCTDTETCEAKIVNVYTLNEYRGLGLARMVVREAINIARNKSFKSISLDVDKDNTNAIRLYKKIGFEFSEKIDGSMKEMKYHL